MYKLRKYLQSEPFLISMSRFSEYNDKHHLEHSVGLILCFESFEATAMSHIQTSWLIFRDITV